MKRFKAQQNYLVFILILGVFLITGCGGGGETGHWNPGDTTAPMVIAVTPLNNAEGVAKNTNVTATFSEAMDPATLVSPAVSFTLKTFVGAVDVPGVVTYLGTTATFNPTSDLADSTKYTATITTGAADLVGNTLASAYVWVFTTGAAADIARPTVILTDPFDTEEDVSINKSITATFSEPMDPATLASPATSFTLKTFVGAVDVPGVVTYLGTTATYNPNSDLTPSTKYTATITTGAKDLAQNALAVNKVWTFTTGAAADTTKPTVLLTDPDVDATGSCINQLITATFDEAMDPATLVSPATTFTLKTFVGSVNVPGVVTYDAPTKMATFTLGSNLANSTKYTATITTGAKDLAGNGLAVDKVWSFTTGTTTCSPPVTLGILDPFAIASAGGITNTGATKINGDVVLDPLGTCNAVAVGTGNDFGLCGGTPPTHNAGELVITQTHPDTTTADAVMAALLAKWNSLTKANLPGATVLGCGVIGTAGGGGAGIGCAGNSTLPPGVYISATDSSIGVSGTLTLDALGDPDAVWVFQAPSSTVTTAVSSTISLTGGAKASNVWWQVGSSATLNSGTTFQGNILASASISMGTGATSCGRLLSGASGAGAFTFLANTVSVPGHISAPGICD
ncbi:MAG: Ig-like domain-containing protein [Thermodesulfovibrionia bacterium]|nr:Ig-like domain-containing protein [Thermodesulfovibrionia bacterium]